MAKRPTRSTKRTSGPVAPTKSAQRSKPAPNKAKPPKPPTRKDEKDIDRADSEGMGQPQGLPAKPKRGQTVAPTKGPAKKSKPSKR